MFSKKKMGKFGVRAQCKSCDAAYRSLNKEHIAKYQKEYHKYYGPTYREINRDKLIKYKARWREVNPEKNHNYRLKRRVLINNNGAYLISEKYMRRIYSSPCTYCGSVDNITADHIIPVTRGGTHSIGNLTSACKSCNSSKRDSLLMEWKIRRNNDRGNKYK